MNNMIFTVMIVLTGLSSVAQQPSWIDISRDEDCNTLTVGINGTVIPMVEQEEESSNFYYSNGGEIIFSAADISVGGNEKTPVVRFTAFLHMEHFLNYDIANTVGVFTGLGMRNVGFIYDQTQEIRKKHRVYTLGIPVGLKLGKLDDYFIYGGYEIEFPFNYKEKTFEGGNKVKYNEWFSPRTPSYYNTAFFGIHFSERFSVKLKYYFDNFFDQNYTDAAGMEPYEDFNANMFYISFGTKLIKD